MVWWSLAPPWSVWPADLPQVVHRVAREKGTSTVMAWGCPSEEEAHHFLFGPQHQQTEEQLLPCLTIIVRDVFHHWLHPFQPGPAHPSISEASTRWWKNRLFPAGAPLMDHNSLLRNYKFWVIIRASIRLFSHFLEDDELYFNCWFMQLSVPRPWSSMKCGQICKWFPR